MAEQARYERIGPPRKLRRRTRRTTWRCRIYHVPEERFRRADAIHVAAHAVVAFDFGIPIRRAVFDGRHRVFEAAWTSLAYARDDASTEARIALERDCIVVQCGVVGRALALGWSHKVWGWDDQSLACDLMERFEYDSGVVTGWFDYQRERARVLLTDPATWTRVELLAQRLRAMREMDGGRGVPRGPDHRRHGGAIRCRMAHAADARGGVERGTGLAPTNAHGSATRDGRLPSGATGGVVTIARLQRGVTLADVLVHEAGHAVAAWELGVRIGAIHVHMRVREGRMTFASDVGLGRFPAGSEALRLAIEREMVVLHAGLVAQKRFHYEGACGLVPRTDYEGILATALQVETDLRLIDE